MRDQREIFSRHRGPYKFCVTRPNTKKPGFHSSEWLTSEETDPDELIEAARSFLDDPQDTIASVGVFSLRENQFVTSFNRAYFEALDAGQIEAAA